MNWFMGNVVPCCHVPLIRCMVLFPVFACILFVSVNLLSLSSFLIPVGQQHSMVIPSLSVQMCVSCSSGSRLVPYVVSPLSLSFSNWLVCSMFIVAPFVGFLVC